VGLAVCLVWCSVAYDVCCLYVCCLWGVEEKKAAWGLAHGTDDGILV